MARMPREQAMERLTSLIASLPTGATASLSPELVAAEPDRAFAASGAVGVNAHAAAAPLPAAPTQRTRLFVGVGVLALLLLAYFILTA